MVHDTTPKIQSLPCRLPFSLICLVFSYFSDFCLRCIARLLLLTAPAINLQNLTRIKVVMLYAPLDSLLVQEASQRYSRALQTERLCLPEDQTILAGTPSLNLQVMTRPTQSLIRTSRTRSPTDIRRWKRSDNTSPVVCNKKVLLFMFGERKN